MASFHEAARARSRLRAARTRASPTRSWWRASPGALPPREAWALAARASRGGRCERDDRLPEPHVSAGFLRLLQDWDWDGAERELRRAVELAPLDGRPHQWLGLAPRPARPLATRRRRALRAGRGARPALAGRLGPRGPAPRLRRRPRGRARAARGARSSSTRTSSSATGRSAAPCRTSAATTRRSAELRRAAGAGRGHRLHGARSRAQPRPRRPGGGGAGALARGAGRRLPYQAAPPSTSRSARRRARSRSCGRPRGARGLGRRHAVDPAMRPLRGEPAFERSGAPRPRRLRRSTPAPPPPVGFPPARQQARLDVVAVEPGDEVELDVLRAGGLALVVVRAVAEARRRPSPRPSCARACSARAGPAAAGRAARPWRAMNSMAEAFGQAATQAPQPMQAAASIAESASVLGHRDARWRRARCRSRRRRSRPRR